MEGKIPIIIPLGNGSKYGNDELRLLLRSIERNAIGFGRIHLVTVFPPDWLKADDGLVVVPICDRYPADKDANLHRKVLLTLERFGIGDFVFTADDAAFLKPVELGSIPVIHNHRPNSAFYVNKPTKWQLRVRNTLEWAKRRGVELPHNMESHCPQVFDGKALIDGMKDVDYSRRPGLTIYTTWRVVTDTWRESIPQDGWKESYEMPCTAQDAVLEKPFCGYNDIGFQGLRERLFKEFPEKSRWEK